MGEDGIEFCPKGFHFGFAWVPAPSPPGEWTDSPTVWHTMRVWAQFRKHFDFCDFSLFSPILSNPFFQPSLSDSAFQDWQGRGIEKFKDLFIGAWHHSHNYMRSLIYQTPIFSDTCRQDTFSILKWLVSLGQPLRRRWYVTTMFASITQGLDIRHLWQIDGHKTGFSGQK